MRSRVIERTMFYGASRNIFQKASNLRNNLTEAEETLWKELKNRQIFKAKFRRQHPVDIFIVDFYCHKYKLVIEVDGGIHSDKEIAEYDINRTHELEKSGIKILRVKNKEVMNDIQSVTKRILGEIEKMENSQSYHTPTL